jgi:hypothetical protein
MDFFNKHYYFKFTPAHTGMYRFTTSNSTNLIPQIDIYNSSGSPISGGNFYTGTTNIDKSIVLTGNTDYYIRFIHYSYNGSFTFKVQETTYSLNYWANNSGTSDSSITNIPSSSSGHSYNESVTISSTIPRKFPCQFDDWYSINENMHRDPGTSFNI